ncbi:HEAT repeat domain-containing protein [Kitasatospora sp. NPDC089797]|uniref:HEAT repeat domain-containing protein n=1 Tax=Kitasatospora sp. NPDC089797 TaxID=3155298 RepID=UPI003417F25E
MLGFVRTDNEALVSCLGDPHRAVAAYWELLRRNEDALDAIRAGLSHASAAVREGCCRLLDHLVDTESMGQLIAMADDPDARVRIAAFHALACDRCKGDTCAPGADRVLEPALRHLACDPDPQVRLRAVELVGKFVHSDARALAAVEESHAEDPNPAVRKKAGWFAPGGTVYRRTAPHASR